MPHVGYSRDDSGDAAMAIVFSVCLVVGLVCMLVSPHSSHKPAPAGDSEMTEHEPKQCEAMDCNLPGIYTEPDLEGAMYCLHHCRRAMGVVQKVHIKDLEKERDHWKAVAKERDDKVHELIRTIKEINTRIEKLKKSFKDMTTSLISVSKTSKPSKPGWGN